MYAVTQALIALVALQHVFFFVLEAFLWKKPFGRKVFRTTPEFAEQSAALAANQGLYNLFLAAGLVWALVLSLQERPLVCTKPSWTVLPLIS